MKKLLLLTFFSLFYATTQAQLYKSVIVIDHEVGQNDDIEYKNSTILITPTQVSLKITPDAINPTICTFYKKIINQENMGTYSHTMYVLNDSQQFNMLNICSYYTPQKYNGYIYKTTISFIVVNSDEQPIMFITFYCK